MAADPQRTGGGSASDTDTVPADGPTVERLEDQIDWYDRKSNRHQRTYRWLKVLEVVVAALIPFSAGYSPWPVVTGILGVLVVVLEGLQGLFQYHRNWMMYRSTCEALKHEKYLWRASAGPYSNVDDPTVLLAERIESIISRENANWISARRYAHSRFTGAA